MILLKPVKTSPRQGLILENPTLEDVDHYLPTSNSKRLCAFDYETTGLERSDKIVGVSFVDEQHTAGVYLSFKNIDTIRQQLILERIAQRPSIAHNAQFEQWMTFSHIEQYANVKYDTQCLLNQIEGDYAGIPGNKSLKPLQVAMLGWEDKGDVELDAWLVANGFVDAKGKVLKGEMHNAPDSVLGKYCNLDAQATWDLYNAVYAPVLERFPEFDLYHSRDFQNLICLIDEARREGITISRKKLEQHSKKISERMGELMQDFFHHSEATSHINEYNKGVLYEHLDNEPPKLNKKGTKTLVRWTKWNDKTETIKATQHFNPNSKKQLAWLFYDSMYEAELDWSTAYGWSGEPRTNKKGQTLIKCELTVNGKIIKWDNWVKDPDAEPNRKVDKNTLPHLGSAGELLIEYNKLNKELGYVEAMLATSPVGVHHTQLRVSGTKTDRCSGGSKHNIGGETFKLNIQQIPKSRGYLECLGAAQGNTIIQMDIDALEPVVLAELSNCPSYMALYGPDAPPNDVYLFIASQIPQFSQEIRNAGYDPENPTLEGINRAKKECKRIRSICKIIHLSAGYGAGAPKIYETLRDIGISITLTEVKDIRKMYWEVFKGVTAYRETLTTEWKANKGFFIDGLGTPVTVTREFEKDILNRCIQRTGHMILVKYLYHLNQIRKEGSSLKPMMVDFHDETVWQIKKIGKQSALKLFNDAWSLTNNELNGIIPLSGEPMACESFADFKCEE